jgi:hypothetical protein
MSKNKLFDFDEWGADPFEFDQEKGVPGINLFANALQVWGWCQNHTASVAEASSAFNVAPQRIIEAVEFHNWLFLTGPREDYSKLIIEHDGE